MCCASATCPIPKQALVPFTKACVKDAVAPAMVMKTVMSTIIPFEDMIRWF